MKLSSLSHLLVIVLGLSSCSRSTSVSSTPADSHTVERQDQKPNKPLVNLGLCGDEESNRVAQSLRIMDDTVTPRSQAQNKPSLENIQAWHAAGKRAVAVVTKNLRDHPFECRISNKNGKGDESASRIITDRLTALQAEMTYLEQSYRGKF